MQTSNPDEKIGKKVGGYVRVSSFEQVEKGTSIDEQKKIIAEECFRRGWDLVKIYCDEGESGKTTNRGGLNALQHDAQKGMIQTIMFTKSDRLTRSIRDLSNLWHDWTERGLEIICIEQPEINSKGIYGKLLRNLLGIFAEWERDTIIERTTSGRMARWRNNDAIMGTLPFGYEYDKTNHKIILHPEKARICRRIFHMYLKKEISTREIAVRLSKASIPSPSCKKHWPYATIIKLLKNPAYAGESDLNMYEYETRIGRDEREYRMRSKRRKDRSKWITIKYPPIISKENHLRILDKMTFKRSSIFQHKDKIWGKYFLLENIRIYCGECGRRISVQGLRRNNKSKEYYLYYRCRRNAISWKDLATESRNNRKCDIRLDGRGLDNFVFGQIMELLGGIVNITRCGLNDLSLQKIMEQVQINPTVLPLEAASVSSEYAGCYRINSWEVRRCSAEDLKYMRYLSQRYSQYTESMNTNTDPAIRRYDWNDRNENDYLRIRSEQILSAGPPMNVPREISCYIERMSFNEKKRVIEAILSPEAGANCTIRWASPSDLHDGCSKLQVERRDRSYSGAFRNEPLIIQITIFANLRRIQELVWEVGNHIILRSTE